MRLKLNCRRQPGWGSCRSPGRHLRQRGSGCFDLDHPIWKGM